MCISISVKPLSKASFCLSLEHMRPPLGWWKGHESFLFSWISPLWLYRKSTKSHVGARIPCKEIVKSGCLNKDVDNASSFCGDDCLQPVTFSLKTTTGWRRGCLLASWEQWNTDFCALEARNFTEMISPIWRFGQNPCGGVQVACRPFIKMPVCPADCEESLSFTLFWEEDQT